jgi:hypothetical protein
MLFFACDRYFTGANTRVLYVWYRCLLFCNFMFPSHMKLISIQLSTDNYEKTYEATAGGQRSTLFGGTNYVRSTSPLNLHRIKKSRSIVSRIVVLFRESIRNTGEVQYLYNTKWTVLFPWFFLKWKTKVKWFRYMPWRRLGGEEL